METIDFILNYPTDWENQEYNNKRLRFHNVLNYQIKEIPFHSHPTILDFKDHGEVQYVLGSDQNQIEVQRRQIELITNAGSRLLEYTTLELLDMTVESANTGS